METKQFICIGMITAAMTALTACEPMEDNSWTKNSKVILHWEGQGSDPYNFPPEVKQLNLYYYPKDHDAEVISQTMQSNEIALDIPTNFYNVMALQDNEFIGEDKRYGYISIELPTAVNELAEKVITKNPDTQVWAGMKENVQIDFDQRSTLDINMKHMLKKLNFVVRIADTAELVEQCTVDIAGMVTKMKLHNSEKDPESEAVMIFNLIKHGRFMNTERFLTEYRGSVYCLGSIGRNVLYFTYTDARQEKRVAKYDLSQYLMDWNTTEMTAAIYINADNNEVFLEGWEEGDVRDMIFDSITIF